MKEIFPGIYQLVIDVKKLPTGSVNTYLIQDKTDYAIIDTGWDLPEAIDSMNSQLSEFGISFSQIKKVILTHCHSDHLGLMNQFKVLNQATIYLHRQEIDLINIRYNTNHDFWKELDEFLKVHGMLEADLTAQSFEMANPKALATPDILLEGGEEIPVGGYILRVINTPGHTPGHISLYEPQNKCLFSGDVLLPTIVTNAAGHIQHMTNPLKQYLQSLQILRELDISLVLPGHEYVFPGHRQRIDQITERYRQKREATAKVFIDRHQPITASGVAELLIWTPGTRAVGWDKLSSLNKRFAVLQTIALLEELVFDNRIDRLSISGKTYYQTKV